MTSPHTDIHDYLADIGDRVRAERQSRHWSKEELATRAGISRASVTATEYGRYKVTLPTLISICRGLGMHVADLLSDEWTMPVREDRPRLTPRQVEAVVLCADGGSLLDVARMLGTSRQDVGARLSEAYRRLGVPAADRAYRRADAPRRRLEALRAAQRLGLVEDRGMSPAGAPGE